MKKVVVIGGGFAGSYVARELQNKFDVTMIDNKDYFEFTPGILRMIVSPKNISRIHAKHEHYLNKAKFLHGHIKKVDLHYVYFGKSKIKYDYLVVCSGSKYNQPIKQKNIVLADRGENLINSHGRLLKANKILIIGGGLVGVELAAEIKHYHPNKEVIIIHSKSELMERNSKKARDYAYNYLKNEGVDVIFNERVVSNDGNNFYTDSGKIISADLAFSCTGVVPHFEFLKKGLFNVLNEKNHIKVSEFLHLLSYPRIFSAGDVNDRSEEKTAQNALRQAKTVVENILSLESGRKMNPYQIKKTPLIISLGPRKGLFVRDDFVLTGFVPGLLKGIVEFLEMRKFR